MFIDNDGVALHVADDGQHDAPVVLVLHGITSCTTTWDWLVPHLVDTHRILRLDFRGHGQSGRAPGTYHFPSYLSDAIAVCEQLAGGPAFVLGHSLGGGTWRRSHSNAPTWYAVCCSKTRRLPAATSCRASTTATRCSVRFS